MILIADSGSTKTDWRLIEKNKKISTYQSPGINPFFQNTEQMQLIIENFVATSVNKVSVEIQQLFYYGAGCSTEQKKEELLSVLKRNFKHAEITIYSDLLGAAHALCGRSPGIACILGTGSNSCYYDGEKIIKNVPSYGYLFGDYGSGAHIGKSLVQAYFDGLLPDSLKKNFEARKENTREVILENVYRNPFPNRYLASFSKFVFQNKENPFCVELLKNCFHLFFEKQVECYEANKSSQINFVGSIGYYYNAIIKAVAEERGHTLGKIIASPIAALSLYHVGE